MKTDYLNEKLSCNTCGSRRRYFCHLPLTLKDLTLQYMREREKAVARLFQKNKRANVATHAQAGEGRESIKKNRL